MKLNRKGFTLVELLAVVVILLAISVIAVSSISAAIERNKVKQNDAKKEILISYAKLYYDEHRNSLSENETGCISLSDLSELGLLDSEKKDADGGYFSGMIRYSEYGAKFEYVDSCS